MADFTAVFDALSALMQPYAATLNVVRRDSRELYLDTWHIQKNKKPLFFGAVQVKKTYVAFHLMPVYVQPTLLDEVSPALKACMQGKSCFNFTAVEPLLFAELAQLTQRGFDSYVAAGCIASS